MGRAGKQDLESGVKDQSAQYVIKVIKKMRTDLIKKNPFMYLPGTSAIIEADLREWFKKNKQWNPLLDVRGNNSS